eukprot:409542-Amphidinium_carterae.2
MELHKAMKFVFRPSNKAQSNYARLRSRYAVGCLALSSYDSGSKPWASAVTKARIAKSLYSVGLYGPDYGAEIGDMSVARMNDVRISTRRAPCKRANLRRSSPLELMAYGGPAGDPQLTDDLNTIRVWQQKINTGTFEWPLQKRIWDNALSKGRGRGPIRHLKILANRAGRVPQPGGSSLGKKQI